MAEHDTVVRLDSTLGEARPRRDSRGYLRVALSPGEVAAGTTVMIDAHRHVFGRGSVFLGDRALSRTHFAIHRHRSVCEIERLSERNPVYVNGHPSPWKRAIELLEGAVIRAGDTLLVFRYGDPPSPGDDDPTLPGLAPGMVQARAVLERRAASDLPVLIVGETGTGKEYAARALHDWSPRVAFDFVAVNCADLSPEFLKSELFGHKRGAFTGATSDRVGKVKLAERGSLFLDEIGDLRADVQAPLLRFLQDGTYSVMGLGAEERSGARRIAATNVDLEDAVESGKLRADVVGRLIGEGRPVTLPPLRDRREDIVPWALRFIRELGDGDGAVEQFEAGFAEALLVHPWPMNLRELRGAMLSVLDVRDSIGPYRAHHLPESIRRARVEARRSTGAQDRAIRRPQGEEPTRQEIVDAIEAAAGNMKAAADALGLERTKLYRTAKKNGIDPGDYRQDS